MELNALTRWESIGKDLFAHGQLGHEIERIKHFSRQLAKARQDKRSHRRANSHSHAHGHPLPSIGESANDRPVSPQTASQSPSQSPSLSPPSLHSRIPLSSSSALYAIESTGDINHYHTPVFSPTTTDSPSDKGGGGDRVKEESIESELESHTLDAIPVAHARALFFIYRALRRFAKGFAIGYCGKLLFGLVAAVLRSKGRLSKFVLYSRALVLRRDVVGYGLFLGSFLTLFESLMRIIKNLNLSISRQSRVIASSLLSSLSLLFVPKEYRLSLSMFFLVRAIEILGHYATEVRLLPRFRHSDTLLMGVSSSAVIYCWLFERRCLDDSYGHFVDMQGGKPRFITDAFKLCHFGNEALFCDRAMIERVQQYRQSLSLPPLLPQSPTLRCDLLHPGQSHVGHFVKFLLYDGIVRALPIYGPVFGLPLVLFRHRELTKSPVMVVSRTVFSILRSSLFLSAYCAGCWITSCMLSNYLGSRGPINGVICGFVGGLMVIIEKKSRRIELALYVLAQALPTLYRLLHQQGRVGYLSHSELLLFSAAITVIMVTYVKRPHLLRKSYLSLLIFFFGSGARTARFHSRKQLMTISNSNNHSGSRSKSMNMAGNAIDAVELAHSKSMPVTGEAVNSTYRSDTN